MLENEDSRDTRLVRDERLGRRHLQYWQHRGTGAKREGFIDALKRIVTQMEVSGACVYGGMLDGGSLADGEAHIPQPHAMTL